MSKEKDNPINTGLENMEPNEASQEASGISVAKTNDVADINSVDQTANSGENYKRETAQKTDPANVASIKLNNAEQEIQANTAPADATDTNTEAKILASGTGAQNTVIEIKDLTKDYGGGRGIFDLNFEVRKGETFGFVGTNGSGKTTTIRHIMGFLRQDKGEVKVNGMDAWKHSCEIKENVEYVPGEIAFPDLPTGTEFLRSQAELLGLKDMSYANKIIERLQLDPSANLKRMSKGMKQKTALVAALMADKDILILDEPTTCLDPLMRITFLDILREEKERGKTIFMSSQMFDELEGLCDRVAMILNGYIIDIVEVSKIKNRGFRTFKVEFTNPTDYKNFKRRKFEIVRDQEKYNQVTVKVDSDNVNELFKALTHYDVKFISEVKYNLEKYFREVLIRQKEEKNV